MYELNWLICGWVSLKNITKQGEGFRYDINIFKALNLFYGSSRKRFIKVH